MTQLENKKDGAEHKNNIADIKANKQTITAAAAEIA